MNTYKRAITFLLLLLSSMGEGAEMRVWTDKKGNVVEARFIQIAGSKIVLETNDGRRLMIPPSGLSDADQTYLAEVIPPKLDIDVDVDIDRDKQGNGYYHETKSEHITCEVTIKKINKERCTRKFKAYLYLLASSTKGDRLQIVEMQSQSLSFKSSKSASFTASATVTSEVGYSWENGFEYEGYLACVEDDHGKLIAVKTNKSHYKAPLQNLKKGSKGTRFTNDFVKL